MTRLKGGRSRAPWLALALAALALGVLARVVVPQVWPDAPTAAPAPEVAVGQPVPDVYGAAPGDDAADLREWRGQAALLAFLPSPCNPTCADFLNFAGRTAQAGKIRVLGVAAGQDTAANTRARVRNRGFDFPVVADPAGLFSGPFLGVPSAALHFVAADGTLRSVVRLPQTPEELAAQLAALERN